jgi:CRP-like cAMP-binding protein
MKKTLGFMPILNNSPLFAGIPDKDIESLLGCLSAVRRSYKKGEFVFAEGDSPETVGLVLSGSAHIINEDFWGNRNIISEIGAGNLFAEAFVCAEADTLPVSVVTAENTEVLLIDYRRIVTTCSSACTFHASMVENMLKILARKNVALVEKIEHLTKRGTREMLLSYLSEQAKINKSDAFNIPFDRQELADYLAVDRSALSAEMSKMKRQGLIDYQKNHFELRKT